jgi:hypothetical protein
MRAISMAALVIMPFTFCLTTSAKPSSQDHCDQKQDQWFHQRDPKTWNELYRLFKGFGQCDDGAIGEGFSDDVAQLFLKQWPHLDVLNHLMISDEAFKKFVLLHIDATLAEEELKGIEKNAATRCPKWAAQLCHSIGTEAQQSLKELRHLPTGTICPGRPFADYIASIKPKQNKQTKPINPSSKTLLSLASANAEGATATIDPNIPAYMAREP